MPTDWSMLYLVDISHMEYYSMSFANRWEHIRFAGWFYFIYSGKTGFNDYIFVTSVTTSMYRSMYYRADSRFAPSQWRMELLCDDVSHWLGAGLESALYSYTKIKWVKINVGELKDKWKANEKPTYVYHVVSLKVISKTTWVNSSPPSAAYMRQWIGLALV